MIFQFGNNETLLWFYVYCAEKINNGKPKTELQPMDCQIQITSHIFFPFSWVWYTMYCNSMPTYSLYCLRIYPYLESFHILSGKIQHASHNETYIVWLFDIELFFAKLLERWKVSDMRKFIDLLLLHTYRSLIPMLTNTCFAFENFIFRRRFISKFNILQIKRPIYWIYLIFYTSGSLHYLNFKSSVNKLYFFREII